MHTTYIPVTNPDTLAAMCCSPVVCSICATPYTSPIAAPCHRARRDRRRVALGAARNKAAAAIANRIARKSSTGTRSTRSLIRKNVEPQVAVTKSSASVASPVRLPGDPGCMPDSLSGAHRRNKPAQTMTIVTVEPTGAMSPPPGLCETTMPSPKYGVACSMPTWNPRDSSSAWALSAP